MPTALELTKIMEGKSDDELKQMFSDSGSWSAEAIDSAKIELEKRNIVVPAKIESYSKEGKNLLVKGVGGWLLLFILGLTILGPLINMGELGNSFGDAMNKYPKLADSVLWREYTTSCWIIILLASVLTITAGIKLWKTHTPKSVRFAMIAIWVANPGGVVLIMLAYLFLFHTANGLDEMLGSLFKTLVYATVWSMYLTKSVRVKNTYFVSAVE